MATYKVKYGQNIFDVATMLYGSIEGIFDLLISNPWLNMDTELNDTMELEYHESYVLNRDVVNEIQTSGVIMANSEGNISGVSMDGMELIAIVYLNDYLTNVAFEITGIGKCLVEWEDGAEYGFELTPTTPIIEVQHFYDQPQKTRCVKIFSEPSNITAINGSGTQGYIYYTSPINGALGRFEI